MLIDQRREAILEGRARPQESAGAAPTTDKAQ